MADPSISESGEHPTTRSLSATPGGERRPLLNQTSNSSHAPANSTTGEVEDSENANASFNVVIRQIFTTKQFAVMWCFFMNGLCTTGVGVRDFADSSVQIQANSA